MENKNKPAYPVTNGKYAQQLDTLNNDEAVGISKREYFAGLAMQGLLANNHSFFWGNREGETAHNAIADESIRLADELLKLLESKNIEG